MSEVARSETDGGVKSNLTSFAGNGGPIGRRPAQRPPTRNHPVPIADPVAVYAAQTNQEALLLRHLLQEAGIEA